MDRNPEIVKFFKLNNQTHVIYEYLFEGKFKKLGQCPASEFAKNAMHDYRNDPDFDGIYPYIFVDGIGNPDKEAALLNRSVVVNGHTKPLKYLIIDLIDKGYRPAYRGKIRGLFYKDKFLSIEQLTVPGMRFALYLSKLKGWTDKPVYLPDFYLE